MEKINKYAPALLITLSAFLFVLTVNAIKENQYIGGQGVPQNIISVSGDGEVFAPPDIATFSFSVAETGTTVKDAQTKVNAIINPAVAAIKALGVADKDIMTTDFNANPHYEYTQAACPANSGVLMVCPPGKQQLTGYDVDESITVKVRTIDDAGKVIDAVTTAGATNVSSLSFTIDNPDDLQRQARQLAITKAKTNAENLAADLGVHLVRIVSFTENTGGFPGPIFMQANMTASVGGAASAPTIATGQNKITSNVSITYEIR